MTKKLILVIPGLVAEDETTRLETQAKSLGNFDVARVVYSQVSREGNIIHCGGKLSDYACDVRRTLEKQKDYDNFGVMASSFGTVAFAYSFPELNTPDWVISISPLTKINPQIRKLTYTGPSNRGIILSTHYDRKNGISRILREESIDEFMRIDCNSHLTSNPLPRAIRALTFVGEKDQVGYPESMKRYHEQLTHGNQEGLISLPDSHDISGETIEPYIRNFFLNSTKP